MSWTSFLLGFAIALWIAIVILFLMPDDDVAPVSACPVTGCCCGDGGSGSQDDDPVWIPSGPELYTCANNDNGGGFVQDNGGGHVQDNGGGLVQDGAPLVPAPTPITLGENRGHHEFSCETNDNGGGFVQDGAQRSVVVPMERGPNFYCRRNNGHATTLMKQANGTYRIMWYDIHHNRNTLPIDIADPTPRVQSPTAAGDGFDFCTVPIKTSQPQIVDGANACLAVAGGACP